MVTMNDIARISGVARSTVHAVLTNKAWVSAEMREKVMAVVRQYNYHPNRMAAALVGQPTKLIGLVLKDIMNPFNSLLVEGVTSVLSQHKYSALFLSTMDRHDLEVRAVQAALGYQVDGLIITPIQLGVDLHHLWALREQKKPFVTFGRVPGMEVSCVRVDEERVGRLATDYLIEMGHRDIAFLRGPKSALPAQERLNGCLNSLLEHQARHEASWVVEAGSTLREGHEAALKLLNSPRRPTAVVCYNDLVAAGVYKACRELSLWVGEDLSVVGVDDIELASVFGPALTTVAQPCYDIGCRLAEILLSQLANPSAPAECETFAPRLVVRNSVKKM